MPNAFSVNGIPDNDTNEPNQTNFFLFHIPTNKSNKSQMDSAGVDHIYIYSDMIDMERCHLCYAIFVVGRNDTALVLQQMPPSYTFISE